MYLRLFADNGLETKRLPVGMNTNRSTTNRSKKFVHRQMICRLTNNLFFDKLTMIYWSTNDLSLHKLTNLSKGKFGFFRAWAWINLNFRNLVHESVPLTSCRALLSYSTLRLEWCINGETWKTLFFIDGDTGHFVKQVLIAIARLYLCTDTQVSTHWFLLRKMSISVYTRTL